MKKTTAEKLQAVTEEIRKTLPRLMEVGEGCIIVWKKNNADYKIMVEQLHKYHLLSPRSGSLKPLLKEGIKDWKIIGKEPMLNDVLEFVMEIAIDDTEIFFILTNWDSSNPYLKNQSKEVIEFLYNLIK